MSGLRERQKEITSQYHPGSGRGAFECQGLRETTDEQIDGDAGVSAPMVFKY